MEKPQQYIDHKLSRCRDILNKSQIDANMGYWQDILNPRQQE